MTTDDMDGKKDRLTAKTATAIEAGIFTTDYTDYTDKNPQTRGSYP